MISSSVAALISEIPFRIVVADRHRDDGAGRQGAVPKDVFAPSNTEDCATVLRSLNSVHQPCVIQGGRTGLAGGARVRDGEVVLSTEQMRDPPVVDAVAGTMRVGAGITLQEAQFAAADAGWMLAADLGARGSATIGGMIATNAGGPLAIRFGTFRKQVVGLEAVLADGEIVSRMGGLWKDNTGYDLQQMIMASEGTLGVVTAALLRLHPLPRARAAALCACESVTAAQELLPQLRSRFGFLLQACEFIATPLFEMSVAHLGIPRPFPAPSACHLMVEISSTVELDLQALLAQELAAMMGPDLLLDGIVSQSERDRLTFWSIRDGCNDVLRQRCSPSTSLDLSLPIPRIGEFLTRAAALHGPEEQAFAFGHLGDGNVHYILSGGRQEARTETTFKLATEMGGAVSAEHGLGQDKAAYLGLCRSPSEIAIMRRIKTALDPNNILNPGRVLVAGEVE